MNLVIRADASAGIGSGHVIRCIALAEEWISRGGGAVLASASLPITLASSAARVGLACQRLEAVAGSMEDAMETLAVAQREQCSWIVLDGYAFGGGYHSALKDSGRRLLVIDDTGQNHSYAADIVLNQNHHAHAGLYTRTEAETRLLLGARYILLRRQFQRWSGWTRKTRVVGGKVIITLGGGDSGNLTAMILRALAREPVSGEELIVVLGAAGTRTPLLEHVVRKLGGRVRLESNITDMAGLMAWADVAISGGGTTSWELAYMSLPALLFVLAPNQRPIVTALAEEGAAHDMGEPNSAVALRVSWALRALMRNHEERDRMAAQGRRLVDGQGSRRVVDEMLCMGGER